MRHEPGCAVRLCCSAVIAAALGWLGYACVADLGFYHPTPAAASVGAWCEIAVACWI